MLIDGNWRLINTFWGSCVLAGDNQQDYWYTCDENFFLTGKLHSGKSATILGSNHGSGVCKEQDA